MRHAAAASAEDELLRLVARLLHDVNGAISPLPVNLRHAATYAIDPDVRGAVSDAIASCDRAVRVLRDAELGLRLRAGRYRPQPGIFSPASLEDVVRSSASVWEDTRALDLELDDGLFFTDRSLVEMAVRLLAAHALPRTPVRGRVRVCAKLSDERLAVRVADQGAPFPEGRSASFVSGVVPDEGAPPPGTRRDGIGLYHAGLAVRALGGEPRVEPAGGGQPGLIFAFDLPPLDAE